MTSFNAGCFRKEQPFFYYGNPTTPNFYPLPPKGGSRTAIQEWAGVNLELGYYKYFTASGPRLKIRSIMLRLGTNVSPKTCMYGFGM
jgi:hypothetical protein